MKTLHSILLSALCTLATSGLPAAVAAETAAPAAAAESPAATPALSQEQQTLALLRASPSGADAVELMVDGAPVLALFRAETLGLPQGGLILLHDLGAHADWPGVIGPLRRELTGYGWSTLSVQLPAAVDDTAQAQVQARLRAALAFLNGKNIRNIVLLGHGRGAHDALRFAADNGTGIDGLILIGMDGDPQPSGDTLLERVSAPIYDLYGSADSVEVLAAGAQRLVQGRRLVRRAGNSGADRPQYRQFVLEGADHTFSDQTGLLLRRVYGWLKTHAGGMEITSK